MPNDLLQQHLTKTLEASEVHIIDFSWQHAGHVAMGPDPRPEGTHLRIIIVSNQFDNHGLLDRHRLVHQALAQAFAEHLHALELKAYTVAEWAAMHATEQQALMKV